MELAFVCMGKSLLTWSLQSTSNVEFVLRNVVRIDEDVIQILWWLDVDHVHEDVIHKSLKSSGCISKPQALPTPWRNCSGFGMQSSICLQVKSVQGGMHAGDWSWYRLVPFMVHLGGQKWVEVGIGLSWKLSWGLRNRHKVEESCLSSK